MSNSETDHTTPELLFVSQYSLANLLSLHASALQDGFKIVLKMLEGVSPAHLWRHHLHVVHIGDKRYHGTTGCSSAPRQQQ